MLNFKKNIILNSVKNIDKNVKGIFTIEKQENSCTGILRIYNYKNVNSNYCLGVMVNGIPLQKIALGSEVVFCKVDLPNNIEINSKISVIVVSFDGVNSNPIVFGSTENSSYIDNYNIFENKDINKQIEEEVKKQIPLVSENTNVETNFINLNNVSKKQQCDKKDCSDCVYKKSFYDLDNNYFEQQNVKQESEKIHSKNKNFFEIISPKIEELFEQNPPCEELNSLVASSKWVTINVDEFEKYYIGIIYNNSIPVYIAYAVNGVYTPVPPKELEPNSQWLPLDSLNPEGEGFWIMFQDALTGE